MEIEQLLLLIVVTLLAYTIKGLTGFGPALMIVPLFTAAVGAAYALPASALFDAIAGLLLLIPIYEKIDWRFSFPLMAAMALGSFIGAKTVFMMPLPIIEIFIGIFILSFGLYLWVGRDNSRQRSDSEIRNNRFLTGAVAAGFLGGITGGMIGMSGPILVIFLKYHFPKEFFRTQLIAIFLIENIVRLFIYVDGGLINFHESKFLFLCLPALLVGLWIGNSLHLHISEKLFNRVVASILVLVSLKIIFF